MKERNELKIVFYGTGPMAETLLITLIEAGVVPKLVVSKPDSKVGRKQILMAPTIVHIAKMYNIETLQPISLKNDVSNILTEGDFDLGIVASYGMILPDSILEIPTFGTINVHPSLLPQYRGPTPIETALINGEKDFGISIIFLDNKIDHGPILIQDSFSDFVDQPDSTAEDLERVAGARAGAMLISEVLIPFTHGVLTVSEQEHDKATFTKKFAKNTGLVELSDSIYNIHNIWRACTPWPGCYFMHNHNNTDLRVKITEMKTTSSGVEITKVTPEGKNEMSFDSFKNGYMK